MIGSAWAGLAACRVDAHPSALRPALTSVKLTRLLRGEAVIEVDERGALRLTSLVRKDTDARWVQVESMEDSFHVALAHLTKTTDKN